MSSGRETQAIFCVFSTFSEIFPNSSFPFIFSKLNLERIDEKSVSHPILVKEKEEAESENGGLLEESLIPEEPQKAEEKEEKEESFEQISIFDDLEEN